MDDSMKKLLHEPKFIATIIAFIFTCAVALIARGATGGNGIQPETYATPSNAEALSVVREEAEEEITASPSDAGLPDDYTGFYRDDDGVHYINNGKMCRSSFFYVNGKMYRADSDGCLTYGWYREDGETYYFNITGASQEGWVYDGSVWYYLKDGQKFTGWHKLDFNGETGWFYFDEEGIMLEDCETPDGYYVAKGGMAESYDEEGETENIEEERQEVKSYGGDGFVWNKDSEGRSEQISGLEIAGMPAEFYMLCIAGETSGMANANALASGDRGRAYGACQFDYRYDLVPFMRFAYEKHPDLWPAFSKYLNYSSGSSSLVYNGEIGQAFIDAMNVDYETCIADQLEFVRMRYWDSFAEQMERAGFNLSERSIAVSAALLSVNVNCGAQANIFINNMSTDLSDEAMIRKIYDLRNTIFANQNVGSAKKGTSTRYRSAEPQMALDLLYGYITIDSNVNYGGGVEWHGNPFTSLVTTTALPNRVIFDTYYDSYGSSGSSGSSKSSNSGGEYSEGRGEWKEDEEEWDDEEDDNEEEDDETYEDLEILKEDNKYEDIIYYLSENEYDPDSETGIYLSGNTMDDLKEHAEAETYGPGYDDDFEFEEHEKNGVIVINAQDEGEEKASEKDKDADSEDTEVKIKKARITEPDNEDNEKGAAEETEAVIIAGGEAKTEQNNVPSETEETKNSVEEFWETFYDMMTQ